VAEFDPQDMIDRFRARADSVKNRPLPPVAGAERAHFVNQAKTDGDAIPSLEDGFLVLRIDLRPPAAKA
jgi:hypothetical protein